jgi:hypothetical protein
MNRFLALVMGVLVLGPAPCAKAQADDAARLVPEKLRVERLARLGRLWGTVRHLHPFLAYQELDWDAPLIKAIPKVEAARTRDEYADAVGEMLAALGDPATAVASRDPRGKPTAWGGHPVWS